MLPKCASVFRFTATTISFLRERLDRDTYLAKVASLIIDNFEGFEDLEVACSCNGTFAPIPG